MKIKFLKDCGFTITEGYDEKNDIPIEVDEDFKKGEVFDGDLVDDEGEYINFQFGDGSMVYGLKKELYEVIEE
jgi:hypothetical protein